MKQSSSFLKHSPPFLLKILSYNIHKGFSSWNKRFVLSGIKEAIQTVDADLVFLQEVVGAHKGHAARITSWPTQSQFEFLADRVWPHHAYGQNAVYAEGHHGNAILSKFPIIEWSNHHLPSNRFEHRGLLHVVIQPKALSKPLHCLCVHLGLTGKDRKRQLERLCQRVEREIPTGEPVLVAGDFNDWALTASRILSKALGVNEAFKRTRGKHVATFPARFPILRIDRIYARGIEVKTAQVMKGKPWRKLSDHAAVVAELEVGR